MSLGEVLGEIENLRQKFKANLRPPTLAWDAAVRLTAELSDKGASDGSTAAVAAAVVALVTSHHHEFCGL